MTKGRAQDRGSIVPAICARLSTGEPMTVICRDMGLSRITVNGWRRQDPEIAAQFDEARDLGYDAIAADCLSIADTPVEGEEAKFDADGKLLERKVGDMLGHRKLQIETRLKLLAKWDPRRYGDRITHAGDPEAPLSGMSDEQVEARLAVLLAKREADA